MARASAARVAVPAPVVARSSDVASPGRNLKTTGPAARDPRFLKLMAQVQQTALKQKKHPPAAQKAAEAQAAARPPANEALAAAKADQVDALQDVKTEAPKTDGFLELLRAEIAKVMPKTQGDTEKFMAGGEKDQVKSAVRGNVGQSRQDATRPMETAAAVAPDPSGIPTREPAPMSPDAPAPTPGIDARAAVPPPKPAAEVSQQRYVDTAETELKTAEVTDTQLRKGNEPRFTAVLGAKQDLNASVAASPGKYRGAENRAAAVGIARAAADGRAQLGGMSLQRTQGGAQVKTRQQLTKERDEQRRKAVTDKLEVIYQKTKASVELKLSTLEADVNGAFDAGLNTAIADMKAWTDAEVAKFKAIRYSGLDGAGRWAWDLLNPCRPEIVAILDRARARFATAMDALAVKIAGMVDARIADAKAELKKGQATIADEVAKLPADLKAVGKAAAEELEGRFKELEDGVDARKQALAESLANKYKEANDKANAELKAIEQANEGKLKGLRDKAEAALKMIVEFKDKLTAILRKGQETIKLIIADPIGFLGNLLAAVKGGVMAFVKNFPTWLLKGLASWLFGSLAQTGISMPTDLSPGSIFKLVMELLGITYAKIRAKAVKLVGEPVVKAVETMAEFVKVFISGGPAALWAHLKEQLSGIKSMVIDAIISWVTEKIITEAATKLATMFNPAGAFVQACITIYNFVMFLIERASQIVAFIEAVVNSVHAIATGSIGSAISWIEQALGRTIPLVISLFARLAGLGGITEKIVKIVKAVQAKVDKALDWVIEKVVGGLKKLVAKAGGFLKGKDERTVAEKERDLQAAVACTKALPRGQRLPLHLKLKLLLIKKQFRLAELAIVKDDGAGVQVKAAINPTMTFDVDQRDTGYFADSMNKIAKSVRKAAAPELRQLPAAAGGTAVENIIKSKFSEIKEATGMRLEVIRVDDGGEVYARVFIVKATDRSEVGTISNPRHVYKKVANPVGGPSQAWRHNRTGLRVVEDAGGQFLGPVVIRDINSIDRANIRGGEGIRPSGTGGNVLGHVQGTTRGSSGFTSTSRQQRSEKIVNAQGDPFYAEKHGRVSIKLFHIDSANILDLSTRVGQEKWGIFDARAGRNESHQAVRDVIRTREVLIRGTIPRKAIDFIAGPNVT